MRNKIVAIALAMVMSLGLITPSYAMSKTTKIIIGSVMFVGGFALTAVGSIPKMKTSKNPTGIGIEGGFNFGDLTYRTSSESTNYEISYSDLWIAALGMGVMYAGGCLTFDTINDRPTVLFTKKF